MSFLGTLLKFHQRYFTLFSQQKHYEEIFRIGTQYIGMIKFEHKILNQTVEAQSYIEIIHDYHPECYVESFEYTMYKHKGKPDIIQQHFLSKNGDTISYQDIPFGLKRDWKQKTERNIIWKQKWS
jgi:hypothetical protein